MKTTFLEYYKTILGKVRFDGDLFMKEYRKAVKQLQSNEIDDLNSWLSTQGIHPLFSDITKQERNFQEKTFPAYIHTHRNQI